MAISSLLFAIDEPTISDPKIEEQKIAFYALDNGEDDNTHKNIQRFVYLPFVTDKYEPCHALIPGKFHLIYRWLYTEMDKIFPEYETTKECCFLDFLILIMYNERYGVFDKIHESDIITNYPPYIQVWAGNYFYYTHPFSDEADELMGAGYELVEKQYGKELTLKLKKFVEHIIELRRKKPKPKPDDDAIGIVIPTTLDSYERLVGYIKSLEIALPTFEHQDKIKSMLKKMDLCVDLDHFATTTLQDIALMLFFNDQELKNDPPPLTFGTSQLQPMSPEARKLAYEALKGKSVDELVPIIYDALESKRVVVMYNIPPDTPYSQALRKKYEKMNYRELAQWVHDEVKRVYN